MMKLVALSLLISLGLILATSARAETTLQRTADNPCHVDWRSLPEPVETETDYGVGLQTNHFDVTGDGIVDLSVVFQITYSGQGDLVYDLNHAPLFIRVGKLLGVFDEDHITQSVQCRVYAIGGEFAAHR
jgi:hypothetical protein